MKARLPSDYKQLLSAGTWFGGLADDLRNALLGAAVLKHYAVGQTVMTRGEPPRGLFGVIEGSIRVGSTNADGDESILVFAEPPTWFGEVSTVDGGPMTHDAVADRESVLVHIARPKLDALLAEKPERWRDMGRLMAMKVRLLFTVMEELLRLPASALLAQRLIHMAEGYGGWDDRTARVLSVNQEHLATLCAVSRQTVNQVLSNLEELKLLRRAYAGIEILDLPGLRKVAGRLLAR
jgi:CRP-like cAMP-binding protein